MVKLLNIGYPALINECVTVGACDEKRHIAYFSNNHLQVDVTGAGVDVLSTWINGGYARISGTSMATPHIAGVLALLINLGEKKFRRELTEAEIFGMLTKVCCSLGYKASAEGNGLPELTRFFEELLTFEDVAIAFKSAGLTIFISLVVLYMIFQFRKHQ